MAQNADNLIWLDCEMTGLEVDKEVILEIATVVTDSQLNILAEGPNLVINQPEDKLAAMDEWNTTQHHRTGLVNDVKASQITNERAEQETLAFISQWVPARTSPMCGNTICQDRRFLARHMPALESYFHYRHLDVSTVKELARRWYPTRVEEIKKSNNHRALADIYESIEELKYYRQLIFKA